MKPSTTDTDQPIKLNLDSLRRFCNKSVRSYFSRYSQYANKNKQYIYKDNGSSILAVAHLDTVWDNRRKDEKYSKTVKFAYVKKMDRVYSPRLDDRLGVYTILELLPKLGVNVDVLLTTDEEIGQSTARNFQTDKKYNWIVEFDRSGVDYVTYQMGSPTLTSLMHQYDMYEGWGSYTDICDIKGQECVKFNVGVGYYNAHSLSHYMVVTEYLDSIKKFVQFYSDNYDTFLKADDDSSYGYYSSYRYNNAGIYRCDGCNQYKYEDEYTKIYNYPRLCTDCEWEYYEGHPLPANSHPSDEEPFTWSKDSNLYGDCDKCNRPDMDLQRTSLNYKGDYKYVCSFCLEDYLVQSPILPYHCGGCGSLVSHPIDGKNKEVYCPICLSDDLS